MAKRKRRAFTKEFKAQAVRIVRESGKSVTAVARELDLTETATAAREPDAADGARHPKKPVGHGAHRPTCEARNWRCGYADWRPGSRGRQLHGDISSPLKNMARGRLAHLILVTPTGDPV